MCEKNISAVILAGGEARRMGGMDKGLIKFREEPLIEHVIRRLHQQLDNITINANRELDIYRQYGFRLVSDGFEGFQGPLAGIEAALNSTEADYLLVVACDMPLIPLDLVERLYLAIRDNGADLAVAHDGKREQTACFMVSTTRHADLAGYLAQGDRKLTMWINRQNLVTVDFSDQPDAFVNLNTPEQLAALEQA